MGGGVLSRRMQATAVVALVSGYSLFLLLALRHML
jgi:hypothetical protein